MLKITLDTNVVVDLLAIREPGCLHAKKLADIALDEDIEICITDAAVNSIISLLLDTYKKGKQGINSLSDFIKCSTLLNSNKSILLQALSSSFSDKEDAVHYYIALYHECDYFITNDEGFQKNQLSALPVLTPKEFIDLID